KTFIHGFDSRLGVRGVRMTAIYSAVYRDTRVRLPYAPPSLLLNPFVLLFYRGSKMAKPELKSEAIRLRVEERLSLETIRKRLGVSQGSCSLWLRGFPLTKEEIAERNSGPKPRGEKSSNYKPRGEISKFYR